ncbi:MAG TPA: hypothetical protein VII06_09695 [Chloroflexota bacterium]|jgi:hypothetical protein
MSETSEGLRFVLAWLTGLGIGVLIGALLTAIGGVIIAQRGTRGD